VGLRVALVLDGEVGHDVFTLVRGLGALDIDVEVLAPAGQSFEETGTRVTEVAVGVGTVAALRRQLRESGPDVIHAIGLRAGLAASLARAAGTPLVVGWPEPVHTAGAAGVARWALARAVAAAADLTLASSKDLLDTAKRLGARDVRLAPIVVPELPAPVRPADETREELGVTGPMVLAVGRLDPINHHEVIVLAAARWRDRRPVPQVVIAGTGSEYRELVAQAAISRAPVVFAGHRTDVSELLHAADVAVVTSERVRPPFALEAARSGVAIVGADGPGLGDLLRDSAHLVPPRDVDAFDDAVCRLLDDPGARAVLAAAGRTRAATWPTVAEAVREMAGWYAEMRADTRDAPAGA
jgi:glycosyltransferase involved in cell wall biosynthesis